ncbi:MAG: MmcQ/YjbR family DNA-binding protein [Pseudomonadales bacterium]
MNYESARAYLLSRPEAEEDFPFGPDARVLRIRGRMFALLGTRNGIDQVNLKCDPEEALILRDVFDAVQPGYHMNKAHWNTVLLDGSIPPGEIERMMDRSYALVVKSLKKAERQALEIRHGPAALYR